MNSRVSRLRGPERWFGQTPDDSDADDATSSSFDLEAASASTPLKTTETSFFCSSPMKKLDNLHLQDDASTPQKHGTGPNRRQDDPDGFLEPERTNGAQSSEKTIFQNANNDVNNKRNLGFGAMKPLEDEHTAADRTMELSNSESDDTNVFSEAPVFVKRSKLPQMNTESDRISRKRQLESPEIANFVTPSHMSICSTSLPLTVSNSDSTPCPPHYRKRLKFKDEGTPSARPKLLNLLQVRILAEIENETEKNENEKENENEKDYGDHNEKDSDDEDDKDHDNDHDHEHENNDIPLQTPISQSTPTSSRQPSPPTVASFTEFGPAINGYAFVGVAPKHNYYTYKTPTQTPSQTLKNGYVLNNYTILGEVPVLAAGLMDESDTHVGDQRIGDPYLETNENTIRDWYFEHTNEIRYPLFSHYNNGSITPDTAYKECQDSSLVHHFYSAILEDDELLLSLLKTERVRWHPDKWSGLKNNLHVITALSLTLNAMVQELAKQQDR